MSTKREMAGHAIGALAAVALTAGTAAAQDFESWDEERAPRTDQWSARGMSFTVGGGVLGFVDPTMRDYADAEGAWEARVVIGTRTIFAVEAAYLGSAGAVDAIGLDSDASLISNGLEGTGRWNIVRGPVQPFLFVGAGYRRYSLLNDDVNTSSVRGGDGVIEFPAGVGLSYRHDGVTVEGRAVARPTLEADLVGGTADLHNVQANVAVGFEI